MTKKQVDNNTLTGSVSEEYITLNAKSKLFLKYKESYKFDQQAADSYIKHHIEPRYRKFNSVRERIT
ncbi:hypothetical protein JIY74_36660 [Vibrio harveyi]|nr:hypothetical protein [Vibrio harveyi]CRH24447.1 ribonucleotide-diphosphate reductase subunit alpha [Chlamydia trachomatis]